MIIKIFSINAKNSLEVLKIFKEERIARWIAAVESRELESRMLPPQTTTNLRLGASKRGPRGGEYEKFEMRGLAVLLEFTEISRMSKWRALSYARYDLTRETKVAQNR